VDFDYPLDIGFACNNCGICCGDTLKKTRRVLLLNSDAERIASHTKKAISEFAVKLEKNSPYVYEIKKKPKNGKCLFHQNNHCSIYPHRPLICKFYPFKLSADENGKYMFKVTIECPGVFCLDTLKGGEILGTHYFRGLFVLAHAALGSVADFSNGS